MSAGEVEVSVVMPAYNAAAYIADSIRSVLDQDYPSFELIVVDDGSTDATAGIIAGFGSRVQYVHQPNSGGCSVPRNNGARLARGRYLVFLDSDDLMAPGRLGLQVGVLAAHPDLACLTGNYRNFSEGGPAAASHFETCPRLMAEWRATGAGDCLVLAPVRAREILVEENFGIASGLMLRAEQFRALGGFAEDLRASEDFDLLYRAALQGPVGLTRPESFARRLHDTNMSNNAERILRIKAESRARLASLETEPALRRRLEDAATAYQLGLVEELGRRGRTREAVRALAGVPRGSLFASRQSLRALAWTVASLAR